MADIFSDWISWSCSRRLSVWSSKTRTAAPGSASGMVERSSGRSPARSSTVLGVRSITARPTGSAQAGGSNASQGRPGIAVTAFCTSRRRRGWHEVRSLGIDNAYALSNRVDGLLPLALGAREQLDEAGVLESDRHLSHDGDRDLQVKRLERTGTAGG